VKKGAVIAAGTILTASTPVYDLVQGVVIKASDDRPLIIPAGAWLCGLAHGVERQGTRLGHLARHARHREVPATPAPTREPSSSRGSGEAGPAADVDPVELTRALVDIDSTTGREAEVGRWLADFLRARGFTVVELPVDGTPVHILATAGSQSPSCVPTHFDCVPPFFPSRVGRRAGSSGAARATRRAFRRAGCGGRSARRSGENPCGMLFVVGEERGSDGAKAADLLPMAAGSSSTASRPTAARGGDPRRAQAEAARVGTRGHSSFPELGESAIDKLIDALVELRKIALPEDPCLAARTTRSA